MEDDEWKMAGYRWVKIDTSYLRNPKILGLPPQAVMLHLASILWTADQLTDGHIPSRALAELEQNAGIARTWGIRRAKQLVEHRLWVPNGDGWHLHDFEVMNPQAMRVNVELQRARWAERQQKHRGNVTW